MIGQKVKLVWPGGEHDFCFDIGHLRALEQRLDTGVAVVLLRLLKTEFKTDDIIETLRLGLQGAGMDEKAAVKTIHDSFPHANLYELAVTAARVLAMFVSWPTGKGEDEPEKEDDKGEAPAASNLSGTAEPDGQPTSAPLQ